MRSSFALVACVAGLITLALACGGTPSKPRGTTDAGATIHFDAGAGNCTDNSECGSGTFCIGGKCGTCDSVSRPLACTGDTYCNHITHDCEPRGLDGGSSSSSGSTGSGTTSGTSTSGTTGSSGTTGAVGCTSRTDCSGALACLDATDGGYCSDVASGASCSSNNDCDKGYICQAHVCVAGCFNNLDCHGTSDPVCIPGNPGTCGPCSTNTQCLANENCQSGQCVPKQTCTDASTCGNLGCVGGYCSPCTGNVDCGAGNVCDTATGHCSPAPSGCSSDTDCQSAHAGSLAWYCGATPSDGGARQCLIGCVPDSQCGTPQTGCCNLSAGQTCDTTTHTCVQGGTTSTGSTGTTSTTTTGSTGSSGSTATSTTGSGSSSGSTTTTGGSSGSTGGTGTTPICGSCGSDLDCASGFCNIYTAKAPYCDAAAGYCSTNSDCSPATTCDQATSYCFCPNDAQGYYCDPCTRNSNCGSSGFCLPDANSFTSASCSTPCLADAGCEEPNATCFTITHNGNPVGTACFPSTQTCY